LNSVQDVGGVGKEGVSRKKLLGKKMNADKTVVGSDLTVAGYT